jgi:hypothetical protein
MMKRALKHFPLFLAALALSAAAACGCDASDEPETEVGAGGAGGGGATTTGPGGPTTIDCGSATCPHGGESACCWDGVTRNTGECIEGAPSDLTCNTGLSPDGLKTRIECQVPSQCELGEICCAIRDSAGGQPRYTSLTCAAQCDWPNFHVCAPNDSICPVVRTETGAVQTVCGRSQRLPDSYFVCGVP